MRLAVLAMTAGLSLLAGPAFAQEEVDSFEGTVTGPAPGAAGTAVAGVQMEPPLELSGDEVDRDLFAPLDADMFGSVTLLENGETETTPASQAVIDALAEVPVTEAGDAADRSVIGPDDRVRVTDASPFPFRAIGYLLMRWPGGVSTACSGTLVGPSTVLSAAHCVWNSERGGWPLDVTFAAGTNSPTYAPYGRVPKSKLTVLSAYQQAYDPAKVSMGEIQADLSIINLQSPVGDQVGWMGFAVDKDGDFDAEVLGYPGDKPDEEMWHSYCTVQQLAKSTNHLTHTCDTYSGVSGGGLFWTKEDGKRYIRAINVAGSPQYNYAVRLNKAYFEWIKGHRY